MSVNNMVAHRGDRGSSYGKKSWGAAGYPQGFLLDTSVINHICSGGVNAEQWRPVYITDLVLRELTDTTNEARRRALLDVFKRLRPGILRSEEPLIACDGLIDYFDVLPEQLTVSLGRVFPLITRNVGNNFRRHSEDGFIVQAAMTHGLTLVTADRKQASAARAFGVSVEFISKRPPPCCQKQ